MDSIQVDGLVQGERYEVAQDTSATTITFYKGADDTATGLKGGSERVITVRLKTRLNDEILEASRSWTHLQTHQNTAQLYAGGVVKTAYASTTIVLRDLSKTGTADGFVVDSNGVKLPVYRFAIVASDIKSDDNVFEDKFDTSLLELDMDAEIIKEIFRLCEKYGLPTKTEFGFAEIAAAARGDKKSAGNGINLVLLEKIGESFTEKIGFDKLEAFITS
jgi:hypothetical protein